MNILMLNFGQKDHGTWYRPHAWASYLVRAGHAVTIICVSASERLRRRVYLQNGIRIIETPYFMSGKYAMDRLAGAPGWGILDIAMRLGEIKRHRYDVIHCFEHFMNVSIPAYRTLVKKHNPAVLVSDWCDLYSAGGFRDQYGYRLNRIYSRAGLPLRRLMDFLERDLRRRASAVTVISRFLQDRATAMGVDPQKVFLIRGSVDTTAVAAVDRSVARRRTGLAMESSVLGFLGTHQSDVDFSLAAFRRVLERNPGAVFVIIGRISPEIDRQVRASGMENRIVQTGWCSQEEMIDYLSASDVFVLPMKPNPVNEARWPNKIGEYMAMGRPVVTTRVGDVAQMIEEEAIGRVSDTDPEDFARHISFLIENEPLSLAMGENARKLAEKKFDTRVQGAFVESLYDSLLAEASVRNPAGKRFVKEKDNEKWPN